MCGVPAEFVPFGKTHEAEQVSGVSIRVRSLLRREQSVSESWVLEIE
jgi:hypothetical protein